MRMLSALILLQRRWRQFKRSHTQLMFQNWSHILVYSRIILDFSRICRQPWHHNIQCEVAVDRQSFKEMKQSMLSPQLFIHFDLMFKIRLVCDVPWNAWWIGKTHRICLTYIVWCREKELWDWGPVFKNVSCLLIEIWTLRRKLITDCSCHHSMKVHQFQLKFLTGFSDGFSY